MENRLFADPHEHFINACAQSLKNPLVLASMQPQVCVPITAGPWIPGGPPAASIAGVPMLSDGAKLLRVRAQFTKLRSLGAVTAGSGEPSRYRSLGE
jgi:hypothetical protein